MASGFGKVGAGALDRPEKALSKRRLGIQLS